jgi:hypothetical protein
MTAWKILSIGVKVGFGAILNNLHSADPDRFAISADPEPSHRSYIEDYCWTEICHDEHAVEAD